MRTQVSSALREGWGLEVDPGDPHGVGPEASSRATLPPELSRAFDGARSATALPAELSEQMRAALLAPALAAADEPLPFPLLRQYTRYWRDGVRTDYENDVRRLGIMTGEAVLAAVATGQQRWVDRAADGLMLLCELSTWCWVAHEQSHEAHGWVVPDPDAPVVDLGAAQTLQVIAWSDLALGEELDARVPGLRERMRHEARRRVVEPYLSCRDWHWLHGTAHNWTGWIHQHLIAGALFLLDREADRTDRDAILALSLAQLDRYLASFPADGGIDEGFSYFWNGACRLLEALDLLITASGGLLTRDALAGIDVIGQLLRFPQRMDLGQGWFVNVADGPARPSAEQPWDVLHRWGRHLAAPDVLAQALAHRGSGPLPVLPELGLGRVLTALADDEWSSADGTGAAPPHPAETWLPQVQVMVAREAERHPLGLALAVKGGHNDEAHNHLDVGSYLVAVDSAPVLIDLGQPTYTALTFTDRRYEIWTMTSSWHNLPEIRGHGQGIGAEHRAQAVSPQLRLPADARGRTGARAATVTDAGIVEAADADVDADVATVTASALELDLAPAYPEAAGVRSYRRRAALELPGREPVLAPAPADQRAAATQPQPIVEVTDTWELGPTDAPQPGPAVVLNHVIAGEILDHRPGLLRVRALSQALVEIRWDRDLGAGTLERRAVDDPLLAQSWGEAVHRLRLTALDRGTGLAHGSTTLTVQQIRDAPPAQTAIRP